MSINMTAPPQQQLTPIDHHYFDWSKLQTNHVYPSMSYTSRRQYYDEKRSFEDNQSINSSTDHLHKKQKLNETELISLNSNDECCPFQAELTQKIDIECANNNNLSGPTNHPPTHHFTLSTVINVSVNGQPQKVSPSSSQQSYPLKSADLSPLIPYSDVNLSLYLKDIDLSTLDMFILPTCPNPQDYLTVDGLLTFLMSDKTLSNQFKSPMQQLSNYPRTQSYQHQHSFPQYQTYNSLYENSNSSMSTTEPGTCSYYRQTSFPQRHYSSFR
ncbi:unnamed protein product [Adineta ricciae]|uniref:Uncharacterized protein n=1 Tax=Adineta ricciae TaxID=249248 RepID=A0A814NAP3_ADIRI|nr:unnamed protein product [Adineta ricciae]